jgi:hypothetical protein
MKSIPALSILLVIVYGAMSLVARTAMPDSAPTAASALTAEQEIARALQSNDGRGIAHLLADDWALVSTSGAIAEGPATFPDGIKSGYLTRKTFEISEPRVRLYGKSGRVVTGSPS